ETAPLPIPAPLPSQGRGRGLGLRLVKRAARCNAGQSSGENPKRSKEAMANYETVIYEKVEEKIVRLTLNRPEKLNALSQKLLAEFESVMSEFESDQSASVLIIRGAGRAFSAGYDLQGTQHPGSKFTVTSDRFGLHKTIERWQRLW